MKPFEEGQRVVVVKVRRALGAKVGDTATVGRCYESYGMWTIDPVWDEPQGKCRRGCYADQFESAEGPW